MKKTFMLFATTCFLGPLLGQQNFERYEQKIEGTELKFSMEAIDGGSFQMGSLKGQPDERPIRSVTLDPFWMSTFEVTWDIYEPFLYKDLEKTKSNTGEIPPQVDAVTRPTKPYLDMTFGMGKEGRPAVGMTHYNAIQFCKWLYVRTGLFYRLPTEAEWEYASRAGATTEFYFGDDASILQEYAWYKENSDGKVHKVGSKKPNMWGLYDMHGNVAEWVYDQYIPDFYAQQKQPEKNPVAVPVALYPHVARGGSFDSAVDQIRSAARMQSTPAWKDIDPQIPKSNWWFPDAPFVGIRLVRPANPPSHDEIIAYYDKEPILDF